MSVYEMPKITKKKTPQRSTRVQDVCSICFCKKKHKTKLYLNNTQSCTHTFCFKCIYEWIKMDKTSCPLCRKEFNKANARKKSVTIKHLKPFPIEMVFQFLLSFQENMENRRIFESRLRDMHLEEIAIYRKIQSILSNQFYLFVSGVEIAPGFREWFNGLSSIISVV